MTDFNELKSPTYSMSVDECNDTICSGSQLNESIDNSSAFDELLPNDGKTCPPDHLKENLDIVFVGINSQHVNGDVNHHYSGPGNHLWTCLHLAGLIPFEATCNDDAKLLEHGIGFTNICTRPLKGAQELTRGEMRQGAAILTEKMKKYKPKIAAFNGKGIYEAYFGNKNFCMGKQPKKMDGTDVVVFVMPSSSARCAQLPRTEDKMPFFFALKKLRDFLRGEIDEKDYNDKDVTFSDYTEFRVTTPDPKSVRKAERRRKRKALAALMVDSDGLVPTEADVRNLVENKIIDAYEDTKELAEAVLEKKAQQTYASPMLMRLKSVMSLNLSSDAIVKRTQEVAARQSKNDTAKNKSTSQPTSQLAFSSYPVPMQIPANNQSGIFVNGTPTQHFIQMPNYPNYSTQTVSNLQIRFPTSNSICDQKNGQLVFPNSIPSNSTNAQTMFFTPQNSASNSIQILPVLNNPVSSSFRFLVPSTPVDVSKNIRPTNFYFSTSQLNPNNSHSNNSGISTNTSSQMKSTPILNNHSQGSLRQILPVNPTGPLNFDPNSILRNNITIGEFIEFATDQVKTTPSLLERFTLNDEKLSFAAL